ncbi:MAG TPA: ATP-binding protein, partial [Spirochaetales bacterium]|nr:ATP-binding protein [Spirochaetales bacterium]
LLNYRVMREKAKSIFDRIDFPLDLHAPVYRLSAVQQHMVEFARALIIDPRILILDELSNKLTPEEMKKIYRIIFELRKEGKSVIYISHDMDEVLKLADRVTILKNGYRRETAWVKNLDKYRLFQLTYSFTLNQEKVEYTESRFTLLKQYMEKLIQNFPIGVIVLDTNQYVQLINYTAVDILNIKNQPSINCPLKELIHLLPEAVQDEIQISISSQNSRSWDEISAGKKSLKIDLYPLSDDEGKVIGTTLILQDISLDKYMNEYLLQSEKMASVAEVAVGVAHEINNPLFIIQNYMELIKDRTQDKDIQEKIRKIEAELERIVSILTSLLSFSRMKTLPGREVNLQEILDETLLLLNHSFIEKRIRLIKNYPIQPIRIHGDENELKQLVMNLIMNSIEAVLDNGCITIGLTEKAEENYVELTIQDNGSGIPADVADKIFSPFFSTKISKKNTGLGLSICRHIVEQHKGTITFQSIPGKSTLFTVHLPVKRG